MLCSFIYIDRRESIPTYDLVKFIKEKMCIIYFMSCHFYSFKLFLLFWFIEFYIISNWLYNNSQKMGEEWNTYYFTSWLNVIYLFGISQCEFECEWFGFHWYYVNFVNVEFMNNAVTAAAVVVVNIQLRLQIPECRA